MSSITRRCVLFVSLSLASASSAVFAGPPPFIRTILVNGNLSATVNGTALLAALAAATPNGCFAPNRRWLVRLEPGIYDLGSSGLSMKNCVDIEGSGRDVTTIRSSISNNPVIDFGVVTAELRDLTVQVLTTSGQAFGIIIGGGGATLSRVNVVASSASDVAAGILISGAGISPVLSDVAVTASSTGGSGSEVVGLLIQQSTPAVNDVKISIAGPTTRNVGIAAISGAAATVDGAAVRVSGGKMDAGILVREGSSLKLTRGNVVVAGTQAFGIDDEGGSTVAVAYSSIAGIASGFGGFGILETVSQGNIVIEHSTIEGSTFSIESVSGSTNQVGMSRLVKPINDFPNNGAPLATYTCVGAYNGNFAPLNGHCL